MHRQQFCLMLTSLISVFAVAQGADVSITPTLAPMDDAFLSRQSEAFLKEITITLDTVPPVLPEPRERRLALRLLDAVLHDTHAPNRPCVQSFYQNRMALAIGQMEKEKPADGMLIWKMYNHGFVVRTPSVTVGFDLHCGVANFRWDKADGTRERVPSPGFPISDAMVTRLVAQCDVLFISHEHRDHADPRIVEAFLNAGKPVVAPEPVLKDAPFHGKITHMTRESNTIQKLPIQNASRQLDVVIYPGQQYQDGGALNNVTLVISPEGYSFAHNGDQINDPYPEYQKDFEWIDKVHEHHRVDVFMTNNWTNDVFRMVRGFDPELVLPGHQNELGHQMNDRVPYWGDGEFLKLNFEEMRAAYPTLDMTWGEKFLFVPKRR